MTTSFRWRLHLAGAEHLDEALDGRVSTNWHVLEVGGQASPCEGVWKLQNGWWMMLG